jgi:hypothetical protein
MKNVNAPRWRWLLLAVLQLLVTACAQPPSVQPPPVEVQCQRILPAPQATRQPPTPQWCSPTCSDALERDFKTWESLLTNAAPPAAPATPSATP